jgi:hypothetical protein
MNRIKIVTVTEGDWQGLYVNDKLMIAAHEIQLEHIGMYCPIEDIQTFYLYDFNSDEDELPSSFSEVLAKFTT